MTKVKQKFQNFVEVLSVEQNQILNTALLTMIPVLFTKITGQLFYLLAASYFGTEDIYWQKFLLASTIPDFISNVLITGVIGGVVIPTLVGVLQNEGFSRFTEVMSTITNFVVVVMGVTSLIIILLPTQFFSFLYPDLTLEQSQTIIELMRLLLFPQVILAFSVSISNALNIYHRFLIPQVAPLLFNIGKIIFLAGFFYLNTLIIRLGGGSIYEYSAYAIVAGVYFGSILHLVIQIPFAWKLGIRFRPVLLLRDKYVRELSLISIPRLFALGAEHLALAINRLLSFKFSGGIAALNYANSLSLVIPQLFAFTFAYASFTKISEHFVNKEYDEIRELIQKTLNEMIFLALPFIISIVVLRVPIVRLTYGILPNTKLSFEGTYQIAWILLLFSIGHIFVLGKWFFQRAFYAARDSITPFVAALISLMLTIVLSFFLTNLFSHNTFYSVSSTTLSVENFLTQGDFGAAVGGIALAMSVAYTVEFLILFFVFNNRKVELQISKLLGQISKKIFAAVIMFVVLFLLYKIWGVVSVLSINNYNRGSQLLNFIVVMPITISFIYFSLRYIFRKLQLIKSVLLKSFGVFLLSMPVGIYFLNFMSSPVQFGLLYGIFALMVSYALFSFFFSLLLFVFGRMYLLLQTGLKRTTKQYLQIFFLSIFSYLSFNLIAFSSSIVNVDIINGLLTSTTLNLLLITSISLVSSFLVYYLICLLLKVEELKILKRYLNPIFKLGGIKI